MNTNDDNQRMVDKTLPADPEADAEVIAGMLDEHTNAPDPDGLGELDDEALFDDLDGEEEAYDGPSTEDLSDEGAGGGDHDVDDDPGETPTETVNESSGEPTASAAAERKASEACAGAASSSGGRGKLSPDDPRLELSEPALGPDRVRKWHVVAAGAGVVATLSGGVAWAARHGAKPSPLASSQAPARMVQVQPPDNLRELRAAQQAGATQVVDDAPPSAASAMPSVRPPAKMTPLEAWPRDKYADYLRDDPKAADGAPRDSAPKTTHGHGSADDELPSMAMRKSKGSLSDAAVPGSSSSLSLPGLTGATAPGAASLGPKLGVEQMSPGVQDDEAMKEQFMAQSGKVSMLTAPARDRGMCELDPGTVIHAFLETAINTDLPAKFTLRAVVTEAVYCGPNHEHIAIPQGARFNGSSDSRVAYGQDRVLFCWHGLQMPANRRHPTGTTKTIGCVPGAEITGEIGMPGEVDNHWSSLIGGVALSTFLSVGTSASAGNQTGFAPTIGQQLARGASQSISTAGDRITSRELMRKPTIRLNPTSFILILNAPLPLEPFDA